LDLTASGEVEFAAQLAPITFGTESGDENIPEIEDFVSDFEEVRIAKIND
jgi:hypothetical protein